MGITFFPIIGAIIFLVIISAIPVIILLAILKGIFGGKPDKHSALDPEETKLMQELFQGFEKMEKRIEALETILYDPKKPNEREADNDSSTV